MKTRQKGFTIHLPHYLFSIPKKLPSKDGYSPMRLKSQYENYDRKRYLLQIPRADLIICTIFCSKDNIELDFIPLL
jgi:hypothetical protein